MQIKVKDTRMHTAHLREGNIYNGNGTTFMPFPVAEAKLVLVEVQAHDAWFFRKEGGSLQHHDGYYSEGRTCFKPILVSETEKIEVDDWYYESNEHMPDIITQCKVRNNSEYPLDGHKDGNAGFKTIYGSYKILALSEHFSPKLLQQIVEGVLKDGDKVLVECENKSEQTYPKSGRDFQGNEKYEYWTQIKLNQSNHITLHGWYDIERVERFCDKYLNKVKEEMYTKEQMKKAYCAGTDQPKGRYSDWISFEEWFEQNVK